MKKSLLFTLLFSFSISFFAATSAVSDIALFNDIKLSYKTEYYPGTIDKITQLQNDFPDSSFIPESLMIKGISYFHIQRYETSIETLEKALSLMDEKSSLKEETLFALGRTYYYHNYFEIALGKLHECCELSLKNNEKNKNKNLTFYNQSILYSAKCFYKLEDFNNAIPLYEFVVQNGTGYAPADYNDSLQKLLLCYNNCKMQQKTVSLFSQLESSALPSNLYFLLCLYNADALTVLGKEKAAYDAYCTVIESGHKDFAVIALKKAYVLSSQGNINVNPGEVFEKSTQTFAEDTELVKEFWIRLAIDEYNAKNYTKATEYFENVEGSSPLVTLYQAKILIDWKNDVENAEKILLSLKDELKNCDIENFSDAYYSVLLQTKYLQKKWSEIPTTYQQIKNPSEQSIYVISAYYYQKSEYDKVDSSTGKLYASALSKSGKFNEACKVYESLGDFNCDWASALFATGQYNACYEVAQKSNELQKEYLCGIAQINLRNWEKAKNHFASYIKQMSGKKDFNKFGFFYKGYAEYCLEEYKNAYASFVRYGTEAGENEKKYLRQGYEFAAKSALQLRELKNAAIQAENVIKVSQSQSEKQKAVVFCAEIFSDSGDFDKAINILTPYSKSNDEFAAQSLFLMATIYNKKGDLKLADEYFQKVYTQFTRSPFCEEALYRSGEVFYAYEDYVTALNRFTTYIYKYAEGQFSDAALFFGGDSALRLGENDKSIMLTSTMLQKYKNSTYTYGANKNLLTAYENIENYNAALDVAKILVKDFQTQAADDEIGKKLLQLEKLVNGVDKRVVEKQAEFEKNKGSSTKKGRISGSELVQLYAGSSYTQKDAFDLAMEILPKQKGADEREYAANNAEFIADYYRKNNENKNAAEMYLKAAEYYRSVENSERAAIVLYGAVDSFMAQRFEGDARQTAELLKSLYPESRQAQRVDRLFE